MPRSTRVISPVRSMTLHMAETRAAVSNYLYLEILLSECPFLYCLTGTPGFTAVEGWDPVTGERPIFLLCYPC